MLFLNLTKNPVGAIIIVMKRRIILQTVVELPEFIKEAKICMDDSARESFINYIAEYPLKGDPIVGTGGVRKIRWNADNCSGKSGGVRVIYYYHNQLMPLFLFTVYGKSKKVSLTQAEKNTLKSIIGKIINAYGGSGHE